MWTCVIQTGMLCSTAVNLRLAGPVTKVVGRFVDPGFGDVPWFVSCWDTDLGERSEPIAGVWGRSPQRGPGAEPRRGARGAEPPGFFLAKLAIEDAI